jgi:hypothetical protein
MGREVCQKAKKMGGIEPLPRYIIQETFVPASDEIMEQLQEYDRSLIGTSYYYIRVEDKYAYLFRILHGAGKFFSMKSYITRSTGFRMMI